MHINLVSLKTFFSLNIGFFLLAFPLFSFPPQDSLLAAISVAEDDTNKLNLLIQLHHYYIDDDQAMAKKNLDQILDLAQLYQHPGGRFKGLVFLASYLNYQADYITADSAVLEAFSLANQQDNMLWQAEAWQEKGGIYGSGWGKSDSAYVFYERAGNLYEALGRESDQAFMKAKMGMMQHALGKYDEALRLLQEAYFVLKEANEPAKLAATLNSMGNVYSVLKNHSLAKSYYEEALWYYEQNKRPFTQAVILSNLGLTISNLESPDHGFPYLRKAHQIFDSLGNRKNLASTLSMIGNIFNKMNEPDSAIYYYKKGSALQEIDGSYEDLAISYLNLGHAHMIKGELDRAEYYLLAVLNMDNVRLQNNTRLLAYQNLGETYIRLERYQEATDYLGNAIMLKDSTMGDQVKAQIAQIEGGYLAQLRGAEIEKQKILTEKQQSRQNFLTALIILIFLLLAGILGGGFYYFRNKQQTLKREAELTARIQKAETAGLREVDRMKSRFFANISHELRTPLTLIMGPANQILKKITPRKRSFPVGEIKHSVALIERNAQRLLDLVEQLLDLSRLESGKMEVKLSQGDIISFIKGVVFSFESLAEVKQIHYHTYLPDHALTTAFDNDKLEKVLTNLLSNAFKFTPEEGDISVEVEIQKDSTNGQAHSGHVTSYLSITIRDNGIGIPEDQLEHIFDRFYRVESNEIQGAGIGLALTKELVELLEGEISVSSEAGRGSIFTILLPVQREKLAAETLFFSFSRPQNGSHPSPKSAHSHIVSSPEPSQSGLPSLLLVENSADVRAFVASQLKDSYELIEAENGIEGLEAASKYMPDLIITDVRMPKMGGKVLTKKLKTNLQTSHIPVIMLTARSSKKSKIEGPETGADDYLTKPFDGDELLVRIRNLIEQRQHLRERFARDITLTPKDIAITSADEEFLNQVIETIESRMDDEMLSIEEIADMVSLSRSQLHRKIKALTDQSPSAFVRYIRLQRAKDLLEQQAGGVAEIAYLTGFSSPAYFSRCFKDQFGISPGVYKEQHA